MSSLELRLASRYLRSRRSSRLLSLITLIAAGGVMVGVSALVVVMGVMNGLQNDLRDKILVGSPHIRVLTYGEGLRLDDWRAVSDSVAARPGVVAAAPFVLTQGMIKKPGVDYAEGAYIYGIYPDTGDAAVTAMAAHFRSGDLDFETSRDDVSGGIVLGSALAARLSAFPGDRLTVISPADARYNSALGSFTPRMFAFEVVGRFETGMYEYDNAYAVMSFDAARSFAGLGEAASGVEVRVRDPWSAPAIADSIEATLEYPYRTVDWQIQNASLFSALKLEKLAMTLILLLIVIVAAFNIVSTLTMTVTDKTREIGILRAMGLPVRSVRRVFVLQGAAIGVVGTVLGAGTGVLIAWLVDARRMIPLDPAVYFIDHLPVSIQPLDVAVTIVASVLVAILATLYPAKRAAVLTPVEAIRYE